ncbi:MAG: phosphatidylglycerophosphatase A [Puniceicoccales bacterium]|jgi:phosphatidylglycerophosphatase A|nr:phosphatidylglycerophosphatase A [Puniceicoccales bacterium]
MGIKKAFKKIRKALKLKKRAKRLGRFSSDLVKKTRKKLKIKSRIKKLRPNVWATRLPKPWLMGLATLGPVGNKLCAPGSWASLAGLGFYSFCYRELPVWGFLCLAAFSIYYVAIPICDAAERAVGMEDPCCIVLDEFVAMPLCFFGFHVTPESYLLWFLLGMGFVLFRYFDIWKPLGIHKLQDWRGGKGIVIDDLAAALATNLVLHIFFSSDGICRLF